MSVESSDGYTDFQIEMLERWVNESRDVSNLAKYASKYYFMLYIFMYIPFVVLSSIVIQTGGSSNVKMSIDENGEGEMTCGNKMTSTIGIILLILSTIDRTFNLASKSEQHASMAGRYAAFADDIMEELAKRPSDRINGTIFVHDRNVEKRRIDEQSLEIPWIVEKFMKTNNDAVYKEPPELKDEWTSTRSPVEELQHHVFFKNIPSPPDSSSESQQQMKTDNHTLTPCVTPELPYLDIRKAPSILDLHTFENMRSAQTLSTPTSQTPPVVGNHPFSSIDTDRILKLYQRLSKK